MKIKFYLKKFSTLNSQLSISKGFTLIELLIVIAILGIVAGGVVVAVNPLGKLNSANLAKVKTFAASTENALIISQVGKWSFEEGSGTTVKDTSGYGNNGTLNGEATWQTADQCGLGFGGCLKFDGRVGDYVNILDSSSLGITNAITVSAWVKRKTGNDAEQAIVSKGFYPDPTFPFTLYIYPNVNVVRFYINTLEHKAEHAKNLAVGQWYHLVGTYDGQTIKVFINGVGATPYSYTSSIVTNNMAVIIGKSSSTGGYMFNGTIDEVQIYNQALTAQNIQQLYVQGLSKHQLVYNK